MKSDKHILVLSPGFPKDESDQLCIPPLQSYLRTLRRQHPTWRISVVALHYPFETTPYEWHGILVRPMGGSNVSRWKRPWLWAKTIAVCKAIRKKQPVDAIHSLWLQECALLGNRLARRWKVPHVCTLQGQDALPGNKYLPRMKLDQLRVVAISHRGKEQLLETVADRTPPRVEVLPWGLDEADLAWRDQGGPRPIDLLGVGSMVKVKRYEWFLEVVAKLKAQRPDLRAVLVGDGSERAMLSTWAKEFGLGNTIEFKGEMPREAVLELMAQSKVFLHTGRYEGQGYVFPEALARGMHVVSTPVGMARIMDKWRIGNDTAALAAAAEGFLETPVDGKRRVILDMAATVEGYVSFYEA